MNYLRVVFASIAAFTLSFAGLMPNTCSACHSCGYGGYSTYHVSYYWPASSCYGCGYCPTTCCRPSCCSPSNCCSGGCSTGCSSGCQSDCAIGAGHQHQYGGMYRGGFSGMASRQPAGRTYANRTQPTQAPRVVNRRAVDPRTVKTAPQGQVARTAPRAPTAKPAAKVAPKRPAPKAAPPSNQEHVARREPRSETKVTARPANASQVADLNRDWVPLPSPAKARSR